MKGREFMADKIDKSPPAARSQEEGADKRREKRYEVSRALQQYIKLRVKSGNEFVPAILGNFSRSGILFECPVPFRQGDRTECVMSISLRHSREISFSIEVKYCYADQGSHIMGASIDTISDERWFDSFVEAHDIIVLRQS
jgi:hypothetical protein